MLQVCFDCAPSVLQPRTENQVLKIQVAPELVRLCIGWHNSRQTGQWKTEHVVIEQGKNVGKDLGLSTATRVTTTVRISVHVCTANGGFLVSEHLCIKHGGFNSPSNQSKFGRMQSASFAIALFKQSAFFAIAL